MPYASALYADWRSAPGRLLFFIACLAVGVAAVVAVATHAAALDRGVRGEARQLLAADLAVRGSRPVEPTIRQLFTAAGARTATTRELATVVAVDDGSSLLTELKAVDPGYPFYGTLESAPPVALDALGAQQALVAPEVLTRLSAQIGDSLTIGGQPFTIAGTILREPDRLGGVSVLGPRVLITSTGLARTTLEQFGSRIQYRLLVALPADFDADRRQRLLTDVRAELDAAIHRVEAFADAQPALRRALDRVSRFVGLVALVSLLLGGVGVAYTLQSWLRQRLDDIAILRCLGWQPRQIVILYLLQALALGIAGSLLGCLLGVAAANTLAQLAGELLPVTDLSLWQPTALARGLALGTGITLLFTLPPILNVRRVSPLRVLRRDVEPLAPSWPLRLTTAALLAAGVWLAASAQAGSALSGLLFTAGLAAATAALAGLTLVAIRGVRRLARHAPHLVIRQGLLALARPGAATVASCVALGLGILLVLAMHLVEVGLSDALRSQLPAAAPSVLLIDIQNEQWPATEALLRAQGASQLRSVPVISARLRRVDGLTVDEILADSDSRVERWGLTREQRLTYARELPADNRLVAGSLWSRPELAEVSVESEFAADVGFEIGSVLEFDVQGVAVEATVTSLRTVDWRGFGFNFFIVFEPGVLDDAPQMRIATAQLPAGTEQATQDAVAANFPNITMLRIGAIFARVAAILEKLILGVRFLGSFTVITGLLILASAVSAAAGERARETALLKTLGMTRRQVLAQSLTEQLAVGLLAAAIGAAGGNLLAWTVLSRGMELDWTFRPLTTLLAIGGCVVVTAATALAAGWPALRTRPLAVLNGR